MRQDVRKDIRQARMRRAEIAIAGRVQGVFYRYSTKEMANRFHLTGSVRNLPDGRVQVICEGIEEDIASLIEWCKHGPRGAVVENVEVDWKEYVGDFKDFRIVY